MFGFSQPATPMPTDPNDRLGRIEAKIDRMARWNQITMIVTILVLLVLVALII